MTALKTLLFLFFITPCFGQELTSNYIPISKDDEQVKNIIAEVKIRYVSDIKKLPKKNQSDYKALFTLRFDEITNDLNSDKFIFSSSFNALLQRVYEKVCINNSQIPNSGIRVLLSRSSEPNALCVGEGTIIINLGLFRYLENESQLAFVLAHELAHHTLNHVNKSIENYVTTINDKNLQDELKKIERVQYNKNSKATEVLKPIIYWGRRYSRLNESTADSLALVFIGKTSYNQQEALRCLALLDTIDESEFKEKFDFQRILTTTMFPFRQEWIKELNSNLSDFIRDSPSILVSDSLKTHPDCKKRIKLLKNHFSITETATPNSSVEFLELRRISSLESVESEFISLNYGQCLYRIIGLLHQYPVNSYLHIMLIRCLSELHQIRKTHQIVKQVKATPADGDENYKNVLRLLENMELREMASLAAAYLSEKQLIMGESEDFFYAKFLISKMNDNSVEKQKWTQLYLDKFPSGKFVNFLF